MGHSQADKAASKERILQHAAAQAREAGLESLAVGQLMKRAGLTHGGFYGHFESRRALLAEALERALIEGEAAARASADPARPRSFSSLVRSYLSRTHRDARTTGCVIAALVSDVGRADDSLRAVMQPHIERFVAEVENVLHDEHDERAIFAVCAMVGALAVARAVPDAKRSDRILRAVRDQLIATVGETN